VICRIFGPLGHIIEWYIDREGAEQNSCPTNLMTWMKCPKTRAVSKITLEMNDSNKRSVQLFSSFWQNVLQVEMDGNSHEK